MIDYVLMPIEKIASSISCWCWRKRV